MCYGWKSTHWPKVYIQPGKDQEDDRTKDGWTVLKRTMTIRCNKVWKNSRKTTNDTERHCCLKLWQNFSKWYPAPAPHRLESAGHCNGSSVSVWQIIQRVQLIWDWCVSSDTLRLYLAYQIANRQNVTASLSNSHLNAMECMLCILNQLYQSFTRKKTTNSIFSHNCNVYLGCCYDVTR